MGMLDANTDRSYFMIGAVIVAGVLIAGGLYLFSNGFDNVDTQFTKYTTGAGSSTDKSSDALTDAIGEVDALSPNTIMWSDLYFND